jgi:hypothetical protein
MKIAIEIGELVVHGMPAASRRAVAEAVRLELARLAAAGSWPAGLAAGEIARLDAGAIRLGPATTPAGQGKAIAGSVFAAVTAATPAEGER